MNQSLKTIPIRTTRHFEIPLGRFVGQSIVAICKQLGLSSIANPEVSGPRNSNRQDPNLSIPRNDGTDNGGSLNLKLVFTQKRKSKAINK